MEDSVRRLPQVSSAAQPRPQTLLTQHSLKGVLEGYKRDGPDARFFAILDAEVYKVRRIGAHCASGRVAHAGTPQVDSFFSRQLEVLEKKWSELDDQITVAKVAGGAGRADSDSEAGASSEGGVEGGEGGDWASQTLDGVRPGDAMVVATHRGMYVASTRWASPWLR